MPASISVYDHTSRRFADGSNASTDTYKVLLATSATFVSSHTSLGSITYTEVASANGYSAGGATLTNVATTTVTTNDAKFDADDATWNASGSSLTASYAILYNFTDSAPLAFIDLGGSQTAGDGTAFIISWAAAGIFTFTVS